MRYLLIIFVVFLMQMIASVQGKQDFWNDIVYIQASLQPQDYSVENPSKNKGSFSIQILSDGTFIFNMNQQNIFHITQKGKALLNNKFSLFQRQYDLVQFQPFGTLSHEIGYGVNYSYSIPSKSYGLNIQKSQIRYANLVWTLLLGFVFTGLICIPISDKQRNKILYNLQKRIHPLSLILIAIKLISVFSCLMLFAYQSIITLPLWSILFVFGIYLFCLAPSILHFLYFLSSFQRGMNRIFEKHKKIKNILVIGAISAALMVSIVLFFIEKGIIIYYLFSLANIVMYWHACQIKKYVYGQVIIYDASLTLILTVISLFLPVMNYRFITFKEALLFWNYYIFLFIIGFIVMKKLIQYQQSEQVQIRQNQADEHRVQIPMSTNMSKQQSIQIIQ